MAETAATRFKLTGKRHEARPEAIVRLLEDFLERGKVAQAWALRMETAAAGAADAVYP